jgi:nucleoside-triphosphatase THEP1
MAAYVELYMDQGSDFNSVIQLTDDLTNEDINVAGYIVTSQLRRSYYSANASASLVCSITDAASGEITLSLAAANTANLKPGRYLFDVKLVDEVGVTSRPVEGIIEVLPQVSR